MRHTQDTEPVQLEFGDAWGGKRQYESLMFLRETAGDELVLGIFSEGRSLGMDAEMQARENRKKELLSELAEAGR